MLLIYLVNQRCLFLCNTVQNVYLFILELYVQCYGCNKLHAQRKSFIFIFPRTTSNSIFSEAILKTGQVRVGFAHLGFRT